MEKRLKQLKVDQNRLVRLYGILSMDRKTYEECERNISRKICSIIRGMHAIFSIF